jgi:DNA-binding response OmpR family regulator
VCVASEADSTGVWQPGRPRAIKHWPEIWAKVVRRTASLTCPDVRYRESETLRLGERCLFVKVLIVDSDRDMVEMLTSLLRSYDYEVRRAYSGEHARSEWLAHEPEMVLLDSALRDVDAAAMCREMQAKHDALVLVLAERADAHTEVRYLDAGADGFLEKPFLPNQLLAHINAIKRRVRNSLKVRPLSLVTAGSVQVDAQRNRAIVHGRTVHLTPLETKLLHLLAVNARDVCTQEQIVEHVWRYDGGGENDKELIKAHIRHLRQKIEPDPSRPRYILNVPGVGYTMVVPAEDLTPASKPAEAAPAVQQPRAGSFAPAAHLAHSPAM